MRLPWVKPSRSTVSRERTRRRREEQQDKRAKDKTAAEEGISIGYKAKSFDHTNRNEDVKAMPSAEVVWDGSDGFDVSPLPSASSLCPEERLGGRSAAENQENERDQPPDDFDNNESCVKSNHRCIEIPVARKVSRITMNRSENTTSVGFFNETDGQNELLDSTLRDLVCASTENGEMSLFNSDKYRVHTPGRPESVLAENLKDCVSKLADSEVFDSFDYDWHAGQEVHRERERLRHRYTESLTIDSTDQSRRFSGNQKGCVRFSLNPFHFSCGADPNTTSPTYASRSDGSIYNDDSWTLIL